MHLSLHVHMCTYTVVKYENHDENVDLLNLQTLLISRDLFFFKLQTYMNKEKTKIQCS